MSGQGGRYQRSAAGMVGALGLLVLLVIGFVVLRGFNRDDPEPPGRPVDYRQSASFADEQAPFEVLAPPVLPAGWSATSAEFTPEPARWHLGLLTDEGRYVGLEQAGEPAAALVSMYVDDQATSRGEVTIDGQEWRAYSDDEGDNALVLEDARVSTLVVGPVEQAVLIDYIRLLR